MEQFTIKIVPEVCIPEDPEELVYFWVSMEERFLCSKFGKDGTNTPDVYGRGVTWGPQQDFWSPVPQSDHLWNQTVRKNTSAWLFTKRFEKDGEMTVMYLMCVHSDRDAKGSCQPKVCQLNHTFIINQQVLGL